MANITNKKSMLHTKLMFLIPTYIFLFDAIAKYEGNYVMIHQRILMISNFNHVDRATIKVFSGIYTHWVSTQQLKHIPVSHQRLLPCFIKSKKKKNICWKHQGCKAQLQSK
jgi:hypothetical protein|uniref:Uncharacterized protein n=1 Tax=Zea mays TaxID=4577 RepID=A0A804QPS2_MAIZE